LINPASCSVGDYGLEHYFIIIFPKGQVYERIKRDDLRRSVGNHGTALGDLGGWRTTQYEIIQDV
jgi:hypothetical protein